MRILGNVVLFETDELGKGSGKNRPQKLLYFIAK